MHIDDPPPLSVRPAQIRCSKPHAESEKGSPHDALQETLTLRGQKTNGCGGLSLKPKARRSATTTTTNAATRGCWQRGPSRDLHKLMPGPVVPRTRQQISRRWFDAVGLLPAARDLLRRGCIVSLGCCTWWRCRAMNVIRSQDASTGPVQPREPKPPWSKQDGSGSGH